MYQQGQSQIIPGNRFSNTNIFALINNVIIYSISFKVKDLAIFGQKFIYFLLGDHTMKGY